MTTFQKSLALTVAVSIMTLSLCTNTQADKRKRNNSSSKRNNSSSSRNNSSKNSSNQKRFDNKNKTQNNTNQNNTQKNSNKKYNFDKNRNDKNYRNDKNFKNNNNKNQNQETNKKWDFNKKYNTDKNKNYNSKTDQWKGNQSNHNRNQKWSVSKNRINEGEYKGKYKWHSGVYKSYKPYQKNYYAPNKKGFDFTYRHQKKKTYKNPYSTPVVVSRPAPVVVSRPAPVVTGGPAPVITQSPAPAFDDSVQLAGQEDLVTETDEGKDNFEQAREAFFAGDLKSALSLIEQSSKEMPGNPNVQQFRSLVLFAMKDYDKSAAAAYTALTIGPGWDWETLSSLFPSVEIYTSLLRSLEEDMKKDPSITSKKFLLAYHYLMLDEKEAAGRQLAVVVKAEPRNEVALQLFKVTGGTPIVEKPAPPKPLE